MAPKPALDRLKLRPLAGDWGEDELLSLAEAASVLFPAGPLTAASLRIACRRGELSCTRICGKTFTSKRAVAAMSVLTRGEGPAAPRPAKERRFERAAALDELERLLRRPPA